MRLMEITILVLAILNSAYTFQLFDVSENDGITKNLDNTNDRVKKNINTPNTGRALKSPQNSILKDILGMRVSSELENLLTGVEELLDNVTNGGVLDLLLNYGIKETYDIRTIELPTEEEYDFIVVGAGSGGSTVAKRLSENKNWKVLLLEAGESEGIINQIPILFAVPYFLGYDWGYSVEKQKNACLGMVNGRCNWLRGKSLGGTSNINGMLYTRGNKQDYDLWALMGNKGWSYDDVLPYFRKSENFQVPVSYNESYHGTNGPLLVQGVPFHSPLGTAFLEAGKILGHKVIEYNGPEQLGFSYVQVNMDHGARCSASRAYLRFNSRNLEIVTRALVTKILIDDDNRAYGVEYVKNGETRTVKAAKEVISSAGTINSAQLLMLSGIGPREHLEELGINVIKDAKVGYNMYEHVSYWGLLFTVNESVAINFNTLLSPVNIFDYFLTRSGPYSSPFGIESIAYLRTKYATDGRPDLELLFFDGGLHSDRGLTGKPSYGISDEFYDAVFKPLENRYAFSIWPIVQHPKSHGYIKLKSKDPFEKPILEPNFFSHPKDMEIILEGIKYAIKLIETEPFQRYNATLYESRIPGCKFYEFGSDDYFRCGIRSLTGMEHHEMGTVKMGPASDPTAVVDPELRVYGIQGLRVVDASIMPTITVGHINAGIYMIGEKGADMIKQAWMNS